MDPTNHPTMRLRRYTSALAVVAALLASAGTAPKIHDYDLTADSLYVAGAYDSLLSFASRGVTYAAAHEDSVRLGRMLVHRGRARLQLRLPNARRDFEDALAVSSSVEDSVGWSSALGFKSLAALIDGRIDESIRLNEARNEMATAVGLTASVGWGHVLIGYACLVQGKLERAEREYGQAVAIFRDADRPGDLLEALIGLGRVYNTGGRIPEARATYHEALELAKRTGARRQEGDCWNNLGGLELERGDLSRAAQFFRRAYDLKRADGSYDVSSPAGNVALANTLIGRYAAAESVLVDAIHAAEEWGFELVFSDLYSTLGHLRMAQHRPRGAAVYYRRAVARGDTATMDARFDAVAGLAEALAEMDSVNAAVDVLAAHAADAPGSPPSASRCNVLTVWSACLREAGRPESAMPLSRAAFEDATARDDPAAAVTAALEMSASHRALQNPQVAFEWFERARAMFAETSGRSGEYQWREAFRSSLAPLLAGGAVPLLEWPPGRTHQEREVSLFDFLQEVRARTLMERMTDPRGTEPDTVEAPVVTAARLQNDVLRPGECLLDISVGSNLVFVFAVTRDSLRLSVIDDADGEIERRGRRYCSLLGTPGPQAADAAWAPAELLAGVADLVTAASSLIVVSDGWVASLPFDALAVNGGTLLIDRCVVSSVPAASLLPDLRARDGGRSTAGMLAIAPAGASLPGAKREVRNLASRYAGVLAVESEITPDSLTHLAAGYGVLHVASHVDINDERPWHSEIHLAPENAGTESLRASQILRGDFRGRVVVLSSCESALGRQTQGEGVLGIASAFLGAGARTVVASLWKVDDRTTAELMAQFYDRLEQGLPVGQALRGAQQHIRRHKPEPFYWAGFVVEGDGGATVTLIHRPRSRILMITFIFGLLALGGLALAGIRRRRSPAL